MKTVYTLFNILCYLFIGYFSYAQYEMVYEDINKEQVLLTEYYKQDTMWGYIRYKSNIDSRKTSDDGKHVYLTKKYNTDYDNLIEILKLPNENKMYIMETVPWRDDNINISYDFYNLMKYKLIDTFKYIDSIKCYLATCIHRCKEYFIWYSKDIPIPAGPWKFHGLPGLIINVYSKDESINFKLVKIEKIIKPFNTFFDKTTYQHYSLPHWSEQKSAFEKYKKKMYRKAGYCKTCPDEVVTKITFDVLECFDKN